MTWDVERLGAVDTALTTALLESIRENDWGRGSHFVKLWPPLRGIWLRHPKLDQRELWPHLAPLAFELGETITAQFPGTINKVMLTHLPGQASIKVHSDRYVDSRTVRVHVPLQAERSIWIADGREYSLTEGFSWRVNFWPMHSVRNEADSARVNFLVDKLER